MFVEEKNKREAIPFSCVTIINNTTGQSKFTAEEHLHVSVYRIEQ